MRVLKSVMTFVVLAILAMQVTCAAAEDLPAPTEMPLWEGPAPGGLDIAEQEKATKLGKGKMRSGWVTAVTQPTLTIYSPTKEKRNGTAIVICPGGGYGGLAIDKEGHEFARWFQERGVVGAVLKYRHKPFKHPVPLDDAQRALRILRSHAEEWHLDANRLGIMGFSAGGHLAASAGTHDDLGDPAAKDPIDRVSCHADFMVLVYPVISMQDGLTHGGSRKNLLGENPSEDLIELLSNERQITDKTGQTFLVHAGDDKAVVVENSWEFYSSLKKHNVPAELHIFERGGHGFGMRTLDLPVDDWPQLLEAWLKNRGLLR